MFNKELTSLPNSPLGVLHTYRSVAKPLAEAQQPPPWSTPDLQHRPRRVPREVTTQQGLDYVVRMIGEMPDSPPGHSPHQPAQESLPPRGQGSHAVPFRVNTVPVFLGGESFHESSRSLVGEWGIKTRNVNHVVRHRPLQRGEAGAPQTVR